MSTLMYFILGPSPSSTEPCLAPPSSVPTVPSGYVSATTADLPGNLTAKQISCNCLIISIRFNLRYDHMVGAAVAQRVEQVD